VKWLLSRSCWKAGGVCWRAWVRGASPRGPTAAPAVTQASRDAGQPSRSPSCGSSRRAGQGTPGRTCGTSSPGQRPRFAGLGVSGAAGPSAAASGQRGAGLGVGWQGQDRSGGAGTAGAARAGEGGSGSSPRRSPQPRVSCLPPCPLYPAFPPAGASRGAPARVPGYGSGRAPRAARSDGVVWRGDGALRGRSPPPSRSPAPARCGSTSLFPVSRGCRGVRLCSLLPGSLNRTCRDHPLSGRGNEVCPALSGWFVLSFCGPLPSESH